MANADLIHDNNERCDFLRSKSMFVDTVPDADSGGEDGVFWCLHTQNCLGPDGKTVGASECSSSRSCFKPL